MLTASIYCYPMKIFLLLLQVQWYLSVSWRKPSKSKGYMLNQQSCALKVSVCVCVLIAHKLILVS